MGFDSAARACENLPMRRASVCLAFMLAAMLAGGCADDAPPQPPPSVAGCAAGPACGDAVVFVADSIAFAAKDSDGTAPGFDLDGLVSRGDGPADCYKEDLTGPDGTPGVDNQFGAILAALPTQVQTILPATVQASILDGGLLFLVEFSRAAALAGEGETGVVFRYGNGVPLKGTDGALLPNQTLALDADPLLGFVDGAAAGPAGVEGGPFDLRFRMRFISTPVAFSFHGVRFRFTVEPDGGLRGIAGGTVTLDDVLAVVGLLGGDDTALRETLKGLFPGLADIYDPETKRCDAISGTLAIHAIPAFIYR